MIFISYYIYDWRTKIGITHRIRFVYNIFIILNDLNERTFNEETEAIEFLFQSDNVYLGCIYV